MAKIKNKRKMRISLIENVKKTKRKFKAENK